MRAIRDGQRVLDALCDRLWPPTADSTRDVHSVCRRRAMSLSDAAIVMRARNARNGNGALFTSLWEGRWRDRYGSRSEADLALCGILAFWCAGDASRVDQLF